MKILRRTRQGTLQFSPTYSQQFEVDGRINSRCGASWCTDGVLAASFDAPLAPGRHVIATFTLGVVPGPGHHRVTARWSRAGPPASAR